MFNRVVRLGVPALALVAALFTAAPASAQVAVSGGLDVTNQYNFRGIRQNTEGVSIWPYVDFGVSPFEGDGALKSVSVNFGSWNAVHSSGSDWYESDVYATLGFGFEAVDLGFTYTSYTSPADLFSHVKELSVKLTATSVASNIGLNPYALVAFELGDASADGGSSKGTYLELGVAPGVEGDRASLSIPVKVGLSANNYYENPLTGEDSKFGYFSVGGVVTVPMGSHFNVHGGVEFQAFGDTLKTINGQDTAGLATIGVGFSF